MKQSARSLVLFLILLIALPLLTAAEGPTSARGASSSRTVGPSPSSAVLHGYLRDANTGVGLAGYVHVYDADNPAVEYDAYADATGTYAMTMSVPGTYSVSGTMIGYYRVDDSVTLTSGESTRLDFDLPAPIMNWAPASIQETMDGGESKEIVLVITNTGSGDLLYRIGEGSPAPLLSPAEQTPSMPAGVDPRVYADLAASPDGTAEILVVMAEQAELSAAYHISDWRARGQTVYDLLKSAADRSQAEIRRSLDSQGIAYHSHISLNGLTLAASRATVDTLAAMPEVGAIQPGHAYDLPRPPVGFVAEPEDIGWNVLKVEANRVWDEVGASGEGIVVANIDTGVAWNHNALRDQYRGWDGTKADHNHNWWDPRGACELAGYGAGEPCDNHGHGTHTMGTMVGSDLPADPLHAPNAIGLAPGARWIACKGCEMVQGWPCSTSALLECADFVLAPWDQEGQNPNPDLRPHVVNNSWGGEAGDGWYFRVISAWRAAGIFPAFSAGNEGPGCNTVNSPSDYYNAFATGATDRNDNIAFFSSRGASRAGLAKPEVTAPGVSVRSSVPGGTYATSSGTSMASPHSAGEVALVWSAQPDLIGQVRQTERLMMQTADSILDSRCGEPGPPNRVYGWGRINAHEAVKFALAYDWDAGWLGISPTMGTVASAEAASISVSLSATGLAPGRCYRSEIQIETNDPYRGLIVAVPVELCVGEFRAYLPLVSKGK